jgi:saccharopine dehydrogenase (NAD+, L-lysine-forming)
MTFGESYLKHLEVLGNVGMTRIDEVDYQGTQVVPIKFLKALLPDPASLGPRLHRQDLDRLPLSTGMKDGKRRKVPHLQHLRSRPDCYREVRAQAVSYTTGVPAVSGAVMIAKGIWKPARRVEHGELDPDPFLADVAARGLPWQVEERAV